MTKGIKTPAYALPPLATAALLALSTCLPVAASASAASDDGAAASASAPGSSPGAIVVALGDPYTGHQHRTRKSHASSKPSEPPADMSKGETDAQHKAYLKQNGF